MAIQELSLYGPLLARKLELFVKAIQLLTTETLTEFKQYTEVYIDPSNPRGQRPAEFLRLSADLRDERGERKPILHWTLHIAESPEMGKRPVTSRLIYPVQCHDGDPRQLAMDMSFTRAFAYFEQGYRIKIGSCDVSIHQVFSAASEDVTSASDLDSVAGTLIGNGTWIVQAKIASIAGNPEDVKRGTAELVRLKAALKGYIELDPVLDELR